VSEIQLDYSAGFDAPTAHPHGRGTALHVLAVLTACATFLLIFMGGLVTSHQAGMSVPDWPNSYGYNMFLFPPGDWVGGILYEHTHRLMGTVVGFCSIALVLAAWAPAQSRSGRWWTGGAAIAFGLLALIYGVMLLLLPVNVRDSDASFHSIRSLLQQTTIGCTGVGLCAMVAFLCRSREPRNWVRWLMVAVVGAVIFQGVLGGLRVVLVKLDLAIVHACVAQAFFCLAAFAAVVTSPWWRQRHEPRRDVSQGRRLVWLGIATVVAIYLQLILGAMMRHFQAGLAIPDLPLTYGKLLPPANVQQLDAINWVRVRQWNLEPVTLAQIWLHFGHRMGAVLVTVMVLALATLVIRRYRTHPRLLRPALLLLALLATQLTLGVLTVLLRKPADVASAHVAVGASVLVVSFVLTVRSARIYGMLSPKHRTIQQSASAMSADSLAAA
jgi:cytochrome c oxidase assembly protein subunit 15